MDSFFRLFPFLSACDWNSVYFLFAFFFASVLWLGLSAPAWIIALCAGFSFGVLKGILFYLVAMLLAEVILYFVARNFSDVVERYFSQHDFARKFQNLLGKDTGFTTLLLLKLNPAIPFIPIVVLATFSQCPLRRILFASLAGALLLALLWAYQGANIANLTELLSADKETLLGEEGKFLLTFLAVLSTFALIGFLSYAFRKKTPLH